MSTNTETNASCGSIPYLVGVLLAGYSSYSLGNSILWVAIHAIFGWLYMLYLCCGFGGGLPLNIL